MTVVIAEPIVAPAAVPRASKSRIESIDAARGFTVFLMIFVNNLAGQSVVPAWMQHHDPKVSGMTFVDLVFPAFIFISGLSIPFALGSRLNRGESPWRVFGHVLVRVLSLLLIGVMMVNELPDTTQLGWSKFAWQMLMYLSAIAAFCSLASSRSNTPSLAISQVGRLLRVIGFVSIAYLAFAFRGPHDERIIRLSPFTISTSWWGILGAIGWAYLVAATVFIVFRSSRIATLACCVLLTALYYATRGGMFASFWPARYVSFDTTLGTHGLLCVAGLLLGLMLVSPDTRTPGSRVKFTLLFIAGFAIAALLLVYPFGVHKNSATPAWACWGCAVSAAVWLAFYVLGDVMQLRIISRPLAAAGGNVLLAYLISQMLPSTLRVTGTYDAYVHLVTSLNTAIARASITAVVILLITYGLNRAGFRLKL